MDYLAIALDLAILWGGQMDHPKNENLMDNII